MSDKILEDLTNAISKFKTTNLISVVFVVLVTIVLLIGMRHLFRNLKGWLIDKDNLRQAHFAATIYRILKAAVVIAAVLMILQLGGIDITHIVVGLGVLVAVITLAMKDAFQDLFSGFIILADKYFKVGDAVEYEGHEGVVVYFTIRTTKIELLDDRSIVSVANRNITEIRRAVIRTIQDGLAEAGLHIQYTQFVVHEK